MNDTNTYKLIKDIEDFIINEYDLVKKVKFIKRIMKNPEWSKWIIKYIGDHKDEKK